MMIRHQRSALLLALGVFFAALPAEIHAQTSTTKVLVFTETAGFNHGNQINAGLSMFTDLAATGGFDVDFASDSTGFFNAITFAEYAAVVFLNTTGDVLNNGEQTAFEDYRGGRGLPRHSLRNRYRVRLAVLRHSRRSVVLEPPAGDDLRAAEHRRQHASFDPASAGDLRVDR